MYRYRYSIRNIIIGYTCVERGAWSSSLYSTVQWCTVHLLLPAMDGMDGWMDARMLVCSSILLDIMILDYRDRASAGGMEIL